MKFSVNTVFIFGEIVRPYSFLEAVGGDVFTAKLRTIDKWMRKGVVQETFLIMNLRRGESLL